MAKGSVRKKGATWSYRIDLGILDGKRKQMERSGFALKKDAEAALSKALADLNEGNIVKEKRITLQELFDEFITLEAPLNRKTSTIVRYNSLYRNHLHKQFGYCFIGDITSKQLQEMIVEVMRSFIISNSVSVYILMSDSERGDLGTVTADVGSFFR